MRVLIVEDEERLARNIGRTLERSAGFAVDICLDGEDGSHMARTNPYDLVILDLMLPRRDGLTVLKELRSANRRTPVLVLTARDTTSDVVRGLEAGSDDYLTKPFEMTELIARCKALIRRAYDRPDPLIRVGPLQIDTLARAVSHRGRPHALPAMEYRLLEYLAMRAGQVVSKEEIVEHLYDFESERFSNVVEVYISSLRKRFGTELIRTLRGQGYVLEERQS